MNKVYGIKVRCQRNNSVTYNFVESFGVFTSFNDACDKIDSIITKKVVDTKYKPFIDTYLHNGYMYTDNNGNKFYVSYYIIELEVYV